MGMRHTPKGWTPFPDAPLFFAAFAVFFLFPSALFAATDTLGAIICNVHGNLGAVPNVASAVCYVSGAFLCVNGVLRLRSRFDNPKEGLVTQAVAMMVAGAILLSMPGIAGILQKSLFPAIGGGGAIGCTPGAVTSAQNGGLDEIMNNLVKNIHNPMFSLLSGLSIILGIFMIAKGLLKGAKTGSDPRASAPKDIAANLIIGAILISIAGILPSTLGTLFGNVDSIDSVNNFVGFNWSKISTTSGFDTTRADNAVKGVLAFVQIIGAISFVRGWLMIRNAIEGTGQVTIPQGATHILGGAMAINIPTVLEIANKTFGLQILN